MEIKSSSQFVHMSPRKLRLVVDAIKPLPLPLALGQLKNMEKRAAHVIEKTLRSGIANAVNNLKLSEDMLKIQTIMVDEGPSFKRFQPVSRGMAHGYKHRTSHVTIILTTKPEQPLVEKKQELKQEEKKETEMPKEIAVKKPAAKKEAPKKSAAKAAQPGAKGVKRGTKN
jgi:large subunit ribosomal protein L22